jgi:hypothetical protein
LYEKVQELRGGKKELFRVLMSGDDVILEFVGEKGVIQQQ